MIDRRRAERRAGAPNVAALQLQLWEQEGEIKMLEAKCRREESIIRALAARLVTLEEKQDDAA